MTPEPGRRAVDLTGGGAWELKSMVRTYVFVRVVLIRRGER